MIFNRIDKRNNMNAVRYYLCLCILMNHFNFITGGDLPQLPRIFGGVGSFFAISGFLMFASFEKHPKLKGYFSRRARRIFPPYVFIVVLAAVALAAFSGLSAWEYFTSAGFYKYLAANLTFMNFIEPSLPGVFTDHISTAVNGSLWTMKGEVICYICVPFVFAVIKKYPRRVSWILTALIAVCMVSYLALSLNGDESDRGVVNILAKQFRVFSFFFIGALVNVHLAALKRYKWIVLAGVLSLLYASTLDGYLYLGLRPFTDSVLVIWCSVIGTWGSFLSRYNSLSYDIYLFHFPIIQCMVSLGIVASIGLWSSLVVAVAVSLALATFSWLCIGKPILNGANPLRGLMSRVPA